MAHAETDKKDGRYFVDLFFDRLLVEKNASTHTLRAYEVDLGQFITHLKSHLPESGSDKKLDLRNVCVPDIRSFIVSLHKKGLESSSIERKLSTLRAFFAFLCQAGELESNPARDVALPAKTKKSPAWLTIDETTALLDGKAATEDMSLRDVAIIELLYATGIRASELASLSVHDVDFDRKMIKVRGKGKKERLTPIGQKAEKAIAGMIESVFAPKADEMGVPLFINRYGRRLSVRSVHKIVAECGLKAGLSKHLAPHRLRHTFATHLLDGGADLRSIQEMMGHASLSTTQKYTHVGMKKLMEVYDSAHPRAIKEEVELEKHGGEIK